MRARTTTEDAVLASDDYYTQTQLLMGDLPDVCPYDITNYLGANPLVGGTITADLEAPLVRAELQLDLGDGPGNLSPYMTGGLRIPNDTRPFFDPGRYIKLRTRTVGRYDGAPPEYLMPWRTIFSGRIDSADPGLDDDTLELTARDWYCDWLDRWIEPEPDRYSWIISGYDPVTNPTGGDAATIFSQLIGLFTEGWTGPPGAPLLYIPVAPVNFAVPTYAQDPGSGLLALRSVALLNGWDLRGRFNEDDEWVLTYSEPDRTLAGSLYVFGPKRQYAFRGLSKSREEVRNRVRVVPSDPPRTPVIREDAASIAAYGLLFLGVQEDAASRVKTEAQATALADAILADTKQPKKMAVVDVPYQPLLEVNDVLMFRADNRRHDSDLTLACSGYTHTFGEDGLALTTINTRDLPAAANAEWRRGQPQTQYYSSTYPPTGTASEGARWVQLEATP